jgi:hypothetical protein
MHSLFMSVISTIAEHIGLDTLVVMLNPRCSPFCVGRVEASDCRCPTIRLEDWPTKLGRCPASRLTFYLLLGLSISHSHRFWNIDPFSPQPVPRMNRRQLQLSSQQISDSKSCLRFRRRQCMKCICARVAWQTTVSIVCLRKGSTNSRVTGLRPQSPSRPFCYSH